jgi:molecular chaperone DnaK
MDPIIVGIDLGTTYSAIAYVDEQGRPRVIPNADGKTTTPSVVLIQNGTSAVGDVALNQWVTNEEHVVRWIKRAIGDDSYRFQGLSAVEISAEILKALKADAQRHLGRPVEEAVITCPAYFASGEIENTKKAGERAGFRVREIVKEPTAAAVYYGIEHMRDGETILVCDLGGGTYDATVLSFEKGVFIPRASMGDRQLGGHDWTMALVDLVAQSLQERLGEDPRNDLVTNQVLYEACEQAKRDFARLTEVTLSCTYRGRVEPVKITRAEFEARTEYRIQQLVMWSEQALAKSQPPRTWRDIDRILLVGGSSRLRRMALALEECSGRKPVPIPEADLAVALGAAILARGGVRPRGPRMAGGLVVSPGGLVEVDYKRIIARSLGTRTLAWAGGKPRITNTLLIPHSTESPVSRSRDDLELAADGQKYFDVPVVEFENDEDYDLVGNFRFQCLPGARRGDRVSVTFHYDVSGIATVEALDRRSGTKLAVERVPYVEPNPDEVMRARPRWVVFAVDTSGSMLGPKMANAKQAVTATARELLAEGKERCQVGLVRFSGSAETLCRPTSDLDVLQQAVNSLTVEGSTAMHEGIREAAKLLRAAPPGSDRDLALVTDGMPDRPADTLDAAEEARAQGASLSTLGIGEQDVDLEFLKRMTPNALVIKAATGMTQALATLLTRSAAARAGGLTEAGFGGLRETSERKRGQDL